MKNNFQPGAPRMAGIAPRSIKECGILFAKGFCMGTADVVPGVSGGTMALVLGIYEQLLYAIKAIDWQFVRRLTAFQVRRALGGVPLLFLASLFAGILAAVFTLAKTLSWLLNNHPVGTWSFFFGLILSSALLVGRRIESWQAGTCAGLIASAVAAYGLVGIVPLSTPESWPFLFLCGAIAICAMVLPGISGSFILVLLGKYQTILDAVHQFDLMTLIVFAAGAGTGLVFFVRLLNWLLARYHTITLACLTGLMIGSLRKIWPWKMVAMEGGAQQAVNVLPQAFNLEFGLAVGLALAGMMTVAALQWLALRGR
jgi:putative membrane protein